MHCHCGTNNRAPRWTATESCKPEVRSGAREDSASPAWLAAPAMNARDTTNVYIWRRDTGCGPTLYVSSHQKTRFIEFFYQICFFPFLQSFDMVKQKYEILDTNSLY